MAFSFEKEDSFKQKSGMSGQALLGYCQQLVQGKNIGMIEQYISNYLKPETTPATGLQYLLAVPFRLIPSAFIFCNTFKY